MSHADIRRAVLEAIGKNKKGTPVVLNDDESFDVLGLDSLERMSLLLDVETALGLTLDDVDPKKLTCINDYIAAISPNTNGHKEAA